MNSYKIYINPFLYRAWPIQETQVFFVQTRFWGMKVAPCILGAPFKNSPGRGVGSQRVWPVKAPFSTSTILGELVYSIIYHIVLVASGPQKWRYTCTKPIPTPSQNKKLGQGAMKGTEWSLYIILGSFTWKSFTSGEAGACCMPPSLHLVTTRCSSHDSNSDMRGILKDGWPKMPPFQGGNGFWEKVPFRPDWA